MKNNWPVKKLGEVAEFLDNLRVPLNKEERERRIVGKSQDQLYPYYGATRQVGWIDDYIFNEPLVLLAEDGGPFGTNEPIAYKVEGKFWVNNHAHVLRAKSGIVTADWLYYTLKIRPDIGQLVTGATRPKLNQQLAKTIEIPVPGIEEQKKIVAKLGKILAKIEETSTLRQETITDIKMVLKSVLNKIFSNKKLETKKIGEIVDPETKRYPDGDLPYLGMEDIESDTGELLGEPKTESVKSTTFYFNNAHVLYGKLRPYLNKVFLPTFEGHCTTEFIPLKPDPRILKREFLALWLRSPKTLSQLSGRTTGTRMPRADMHLLMSLEIPLLDLKEQGKIVAYLDGLSEKVQVLQKLQQEQLQELEALQQSVLHKAFEGKL